LLDKQIRILTSLFRGLANDPSCDMMQDRRTNFKVKQYLVKTQSNTEHHQQIIANVSVQESYRDIGDNLKITECNQMADQ
jgi:hypothetical protein